MIVVQYFFVQPVTHIIPSSTGSPGSIRTIYSYRANSSALRDEEDARTAHTYLVRALYVSVWVAMATSSSITVKVTYDRVERSFTTQKTASFATFAVSVLEGYGLPKSTCLSFFCNNHIYYCSDTDKTLQSANVTNNSRIAARLGSRK